MMGVDQFNQSLLLVLILGFGSSLWQHFDKIGDGQVATAFVLVALRNGIQPRLLVLFPPSPGSCLKSGSDKWKPLVAILKGERLKVQVDTFQSWIRVL